MTCLLKQQIASRLYIFIKDFNDFQSLTHQPNTHGSRLGVNGMYNGKNLTKKTNDEKTGACYLC